MIVVAVAEAQTKCPAISFPNCSCSTSETANRADKFNVPLTTRVVVKCSSVFSIEALSKLMRSLQGKRIDAIHIMDSPVIIIFNICYLFNPYSKGWNPNRRSIRLLSTMDYQGENRCHTGKHKRIRSQLNGNGRRLSNQSVIEAHDPVIEADFKQEALCSADWRLRSV